jgi:3-oxoacyl-[acyl-carrier protein] reductase
MDLQLNGKIALVTGSTAGIGAAIAASLFAEGAKVIVNGRTHDRVEEAVKRITSREPSRAVDVRGIVADLAADAGMATLKELVKDVDILVNNLGVFESKTLSEVAADDWTRMW